MSTEQKDRKTQLEDLQAQQHKMLANPLRTRILMALGKREASPKELAELLDEDFQRVCRQVRVLKEHGFIELVDEDRRRGGVQHFYKATVRPLLDADEWEQIPQVARETNSADILQIIDRDAKEALATGDFDAHRHRVLVQMPLVVDDQGFEEIDKSLLQHMANCDQIQAASAARRMEAGGRAIQIRQGIIVHPAAGSGLQVD